MDKEQIAGFLQAIEHHGGEGLEQLSDVWVARLKDLFVTTWFECPGDDKVVWTRRAQATL